MTSPTQLSEGYSNNNIIRRYGKGIRPTRKSVHLYSDYCDDENEKSETVNLGQRSISLTALHPGQPLLEPRMAQLETLEAKMASIEVSLSTTPRRKKNGSIGSGRSPASVVNEGVTITLKNTKDNITKEMETMRNALRDKENVIQSLKGQLTSTSLSRLSASYLRATNNGNTRQQQQPLSEKEKRTAEERLQRLKQEMENKRLAIKNLKMALERLDITDNIDVRIQQAELEYQLGREELNLLTFLEESRNIQACLEEADQNKSRGDAATIYSCVSGGKQVTLHAVELNYDAKSPRFGAGMRDNSPGLWVEWAAEDSAMEKGDRILEVNGKIVLTKSKEDLQRLLSVTPDPALLVVLRSRSSLHLLDYREEVLTLRGRAEEAERAQDTYRTDNVRLTHRISYLEEQVSELLLDKCLEDNRASVNQSPVVTSSERSVPSSPKVNPVQVYQKGQVTALVANLPGLDVGNRSPSIEVKHALPMKSKPQAPNKNQDRIVRLEVGPDYSRTSSSKTQSPRKSQVAPDVKSELVNEYSSSGRHYDKYNNQLLNSRSNNSLDIFDIQSPPMKNIKVVQKSRHQMEELNAENLSALEARKMQKKHSKSHQRLECTEKYPDYKSGRSDLEYVSGSSSNLYRVHKLDVRSVKSLDFDSEPNYVPHKSRDHYQYVRTDNCRVHQTGEYKPESPSRHEAEKLSSRSQNRAKMLEYGSDTSNLTTNSDYPNSKPQRPMPPKKPLRLSLHKASSLQCVNSSIQIPDGLRKPTKRKHKGEAPPLPVLAGEMQQTQAPRSQSRAESCQAALRWPSPSVALHQLRMSSKYSASGPGEKWC